MNPGDGFLTWGALIASLGSVVAIVTYWMNRGKAEARVEMAIASASAACAKVDFLSLQLSDARIEFASDYASHKDLAASEARYATAIDGMRAELRGVNERLDRIIEGFGKQMK